MTGADGELRPGVFVYRTIDDCLRLRERARSGDGAIVVGGGLLGLEAAKVLSDRGLHVTIVHVAQTLMNAQLDALGGEMLCRQIERCGIFVRTGQDRRGGLRRTRRVEGVMLDDGTTLPADMVVLACGVRPRVDARARVGLAREQGHRRQRHARDRGPGRLRVRRVRRAPGQDVRHRRAGLGASRGPGRRAHGRAIRRPGTAARSSTRA